MNILIVTQYFYPEDFKVNDIAFDFIQRGHKVTVFTAKPNYPKGRFYNGYSFFGKSNEIINGVEIIRIPIFPRFNGKGKYLIINYLSFLLFSFIYKHRVKGEFDVIFSHLPSPLISALPAIWFKKKFNAKLYLWVLDLWPESLQANSNIKDGFLIKTLNKLINYIYNKSDVILISSKFFEKSILEKGINNNIKIKYFPNWAEDIFINEKIENVSLPKIKEGFNIMFAGNIGDSQDFDSILEAAKLTKDDNINWLIVGDGRKLTWLKIEIQKHSLNNVYLLGRYPLNLMPSLFKIADAMLVTLKNNPIFSLTVPAKVQAYMASSKIILGMFNGEGQDLINKSKCGYAVSAGDFIGLCENIKKIKKLSPEEKNQMELNSKEFYLDNFSKKNLFDFLESDFKK
jgi:glycosyltransferase involved in cell wall biosynthesis